MCNYTSSIPPRNIHLCFETRSTLVPFLFFPKESCPFIPCIPIPKTNHALADLSPSTALLTTSQPQQCPTTTPQKPSAEPGRPLHPFTRRTSLLPKSFRPLALKDQQQQHHQQQQHTSPSPAHCNRRSRTLARIPPNPPRPPDRAPSRPPRPPCFHGFLGLSS